MRVFLNNRVGESRIIRPGQMIILNPMATRLPEPVNVRLDRLVGTSKLVNGFTDTDDADAPDSGGGKPDPVRNDPTIKETINDQKEKIRNPDNPNSTNRDPRNSKKTLTDVKLRLVGTNVQSAPFRGRPTTFPGTFTVGPDSGVSTNPTLVDNISTPGDKIEGNVYYPSLDGNLTNWMFGSTNSLDERAGITSPLVRASSWPDSRQINFVSPEILRRQLEVFSMEARIYPSVIWPSLVSMELISPDRRRSTPSMAVSID
jgi:hypothetical protein